MPGGLLNLVSAGNQNVILNGNPTKTFFKTTYAKYTNFGLQKFRLDFDGATNLRLSEPSTFKFKVLRYADLLMDTYLCVTLPTIWSSVYKTDNDCYLPYEFKWIDDLGSMMIKQVSFNVGGQIIQKFSGQYLRNLVERDFSGSVKRTYYDMTGNTAVLNDPANSNGRINQYPTAIYNAAWRSGPEPSIRASKLFIPLNIWFTMASVMAFPLVSLQYNELTIDIEMRPIQELFVIRDVVNYLTYAPDDAPYVQANQNILEYNFSRFIQSPPNASYDYSGADTRTNWAADIHLTSTYAFLSEDEVRLFASNEQNYLIKEVYEYNFNNLVGPNRVSLDSFGLVANWMWYFQRSDVQLRNQWSNYTNWAYKTIPQNVSLYIIQTSPCLTSPVYSTGPFNPANQKTIMSKWAIILDGTYRENTLDAGILQYVEKYTASEGYSGDNLYCYNFEICTSPRDFQPSGAMNLNRFSNVQFEFTTFQPPLDAEAQVFVICDPVTNQIVGVNKPTWQIYDYNYNLTVFEERYNVVTFLSGNAGLMFAR
jgi:hypothetical protein